MKHLAWIPPFIAGVAIAVRTFPTTRLPFQDDDWYFLDDLTKYSLWSSIWRFTSEHFLPAFKLVYGSLLLLFDFDTLPIAILQYFVRILTLIVWYVILRRTRIWGPVVALVCLCIPLAEVGMLGVFRWTYEGHRELQLLAFSLATISLLRFKAGGSWWMLLLCATMLLIGAWTSPGGYVVLVSVPIAHALFPNAYERAGQRDWRPWVAFFLCLAITLPPHLLARHPNMPVITDPKEAAWGAALYWLYGNVVNSATSGLAIMVLPGLVNAAFFALLTTGSVWTLARSREQERRLLIALLGLTALGFGLLVALARWHGGVVHASSYRYSYNTLFFQILLLAVVLGELQDGAARAGGRAAASLVLLWLSSSALLGLAFYGGLRGLAQARETERSQLACIEEIQRSRGTPPCITSFCHWCGSADVLRDVLDRMKHTQRR